MRTFLLYWFGLGVCGAYSMIWLDRRLESETEFKHVYGRLGSIVGGSVLGPFLFLPLLWYVTDPVKYAMFYRQLESEPEMTWRQRIVWQYVLPPLVVVVLAYVLAIQPVQTGSW